MKSVISAFLLLLLFASCKKSTQEELAVKTQPQYATLVEVKEVLMAKIISIAKSNPEFK